MNDKLELKAKVNEWACVVTGRKYSTGDYLVQVKPDTWYIVNKTVDLTGELQATIEKQLGVKRDSAPGVSDSVKSTKDVS